MALDAATAQEMIKKLAEDQTQYLNTLNRAHDILAQALVAASTGKPAPRLTTEGVRRIPARGTPKTEVESVKKDSKGSILSAEDEEPSTEDNESLFVSQHLAPRRYHEDEFRKHVLENQWTVAARAILHDLLENLHVVHRKNIFQTAPKMLNDRSNLSHYSILDVGSDGAPLPINTTGRPLSTRAADIWDRIQHINADPHKERKAVGRITIVREPSPLLFAALHYTQKDHFDVDELFKLLLHEKTVVRAHQPFSPNPLHRRTFVWSMDYFTIVGENCVPMRWQAADDELADTEQHVPISRCSSVIALSLDDKPMGQIRNKNRRRDRQFGDVYDPFSPWHLLSMQAYPDWKSSIDYHDSTKHYVNGPEAFLMTLRAEYKDAQKRLLEVHKRISELVTAPSDFMFRQNIRDKLLFEDDEFTYSRRYFWAYQSLGIMNEDIQEMVNAYRTTFTDDVWDGTDKIIWPGDEAASSRHAHWRKRMARIREDIEVEIDRLEEIEDQNQEKMKEVKNLRENLFSGTSVLESRKSVQQQAITVQQGHNIKLLTLVTIFFLPLTFVTSVYSITNIKEDSFVPFGLTTLAICLPTYMLIGSLGTTSGLEFWTARAKALYAHIGHILQFFHFKRPSPPLPPPPQHATLTGNKARSQSAVEGMAAREVRDLTSNGSLNNAGAMKAATLNTTDRIVQFDTGAPGEGGEMVQSPSSLKQFDFGNVTGGAAPDAKSESQVHRGGWLARVFPWRGTRAGTKSTV